jgi:hypothetical protein
MGSFSIYHWIILIFMVSVFPLLYIVPAWKIVSKAGYSGAWSLLIIVPLVNLIMLWVFAFSDWPRQRAR